jgi:hypothetical protein
LGGHDIPQTVHGLRGDFFQLCRVGKHSPLHQLGIFVCGSLAGPLDKRFNSGFINLVVLVMLDGPTVSQELDGLFRAYGQLLADLRAGLICNRY